jgi:hypothetical protein
MRENELYEKALSVICSKAVPRIVQAGERFLPKEGELLVTGEEIGYTYYIFFTQFEYSDQKLIGWIIEPGHKRVDICPVVVDKRNECWFNDIAGQPLVGSTGSVGALYITEYPEHQRLCIDPEQVLRALEGASYTFST